MNPTKNREGIIRNLIQGILLSRCGRKAVEERKEGEEGMGGCVIQQNPPPAYLPWASKGQQPTLYSPNQNLIWGGRVVERDTAERTKPG